MTTERCPECGSEMGRVFHDAVGGGRYVLECVNEECLHEEEENEPENEEEEE
jgi:peptide methionine sulfoxide reductase MsrB